MSEFKFACPVCGQRVSADASTSGGQIECPTCFQKIIVPQAPSSAETKFILSAAQASKPRPVGMDTAALGRPQQQARPRVPVAVMAVLLLLICGAGAGVFVFRGKILSAIRGKSHTAWSLNLTNASFPETNAAGILHGRPFASDQAVLQNATLSLRQGRRWPPDLGISIVLPQEIAHEPGGKSLDIAPDQPEPAPKVVLHWRDDEQKPAKQDFPGGYALKLAFDQATEGHVQGKIYLCLPDEAKSVVAGTFEAAIRKPKPSPPKGQKRPDSRQPARPLTEDWPPPVTEHSPSVAM